MSSSVSILEAPIARAYTLDTSVTYHVNQPSLSIPGPLHRHTSHAYARTGWPSLADFSYELILLLIEALYDIDPKSLQSLQRVCRRFHDLTTPFLYRRVSLTKALTRDGAELCYPVAFQNMALHTRQVDVGSRLSPSGVGRILQSIHNLSDIHWRFEDNMLQCDGFWLPSELLESRDAQPRDVRLSISNLPLHSFDTASAASYTSAIPAHLLVSLKLASPTPPLTTRLESLKELLLRSPRLEVFYYQDRGQGTQFQFSPGERLPALQELTLRSYDWRHTAEDVRRHWDFSRLRSLELVSMPTYYFLDSVCFGDFENLHSLHVEDWSAHLPDRKAEATQHLYDLVGNHIRRLESLQITCCVSSFPVDALLRHASSLERLKFRDHAGFTEESRACPCLDLSSLQRLADRLDHVRELELDMSCATADEQEDFLRTICRFKTLERLTLHTQTTLQHLETVADGTDPDSFVALNWFSVLVRYRRKINPDRPWRKITINMGGWRRIMVRRIGLRWRLLAQRGIHAERCFILEKGEGQYDIHEEMAFDTGGARVLPVSPLGC